jgi:type II secretory pathway pseudopilin PulG
MRRKRIGFLAFAGSAPTRRRNAFTLVEIVAVYAILTVVTVGTYKLFSRLNESVRVTTKHDLAVREIYRLSASFRDEVRKSGDVQVVDQGKAIRLITATGTVRFGLSPQGVTYTFTPRSDSNLPLRRDLFVCPIDDNLQCRIDSQSRLVALPVMAGVASANTRPSDFRSRPIELIERFKEAL